MDSTDSVKVMVRVKPYTKAEDSDPNTVNINDTHNTIEIKNEKKKASHRYTFDFVAGDDCTQSTIFDRIGSSLVTNFLSGYNVSLFAYGQTGSGKTYTIQGPPELTNMNSDQVGIVPRLFPYLFNRLPQATQNYKLLLSYYEIYNEQMRDLLKPDSHLTFRAAGNLLQYYGLTEAIIENSAEALEQCLIAISNRKVSCTDCNETSSRSHSILMLQLDATIVKDGKQCDIRSKMHIVDLAGSERAKKTGCVGKKLKESSKINQSLSTLSHVINTIIKNASNKKRPEPVRYRDSILTTVLRDSLGGNSKTVIIANVSPFLSNFEETLSTLIFAQNAKLMPNTPIPNSPIQLDSHKLLEELTDLKISLEGANKEAILKTQQINVFKDVIRIIKMYTGDVTGLSIPLKDIEMQNGIVNPAMVESLEKEISDLLGQKSKNVIKEEPMITDEQLLLDQYDPITDASNLIEEEQKNQEILALEFQIRSNEAEYRHSKDMYERTIEDLKRELANVKPKSSEKQVCIEKINKDYINQTERMAMKCEDLEAYLGEITERYNKQNIGLQSAKLDAENFKEKAQAMEKTIEEMRLQANIQKSSTEMVMREMNTKIEELNNSISTKDDQIKIMALQESDLKSKLLNAASSFEEIQHKLNECELRLKQTASHCSTNEREQAIILESAKRDAEDWADKYKIVSENYQQSQFKLQEQIGQTAQLQTKLDSMYSYCKEKEEQYLKKIDENEQSIKVLTLNFNQVESSNAKYMQLISQFEANANSINIKAQEEIKEITTQRENAIQKYQAQTIQVATLEAKISDQQSEIASYKDKTTHIIEDFNTQLHLLENKVEDECQKSSKEEKEKNAWIGRHTELSKRMADTQHMFEAKTQNYENDLYQSQVKIGAVTSRLDTMSAQYSTLVNQFNQLSIDKKTIEQKSRNMEVNAIELQAAMKIMKEENNLKITELSQQISSLMAQLEEMQGEKEGMQTKYAISANKADEKCIGLEKKLKEIHSEISAVKSEKEKWVEKAMKYQQNYEQLSISMQKMPSIEAERQAFLLKTTMDELSIKKRRIKELEEKLKHFSEESKMMMGESKENIILLNQEKVNVHAKTKKATGEEKQEIDNAMKRQMDDLTNKVERQASSMEELMIENADLKKRLTKSETDNLEFLRSKNDKIGYLQNIKIELNKLRDENAKYKLQLLRTRNGNWRADKTCGV